jgi:hypothetical protein
MSGVKDDNAPPAASAAEPAKRFLMTDLLFVFVDILFDT